MTMTDLYGLSSDDRRRVEKSVGFTERYIGRDRLRKRSKGGGGGSNKIYARIIQTLRRADVEAGITAIDYYEIELLDYAVEEWSDAAGITFEKDTIYKYVPDNKLYRCKITHTNPPALPPNTTPSHWEETSHEKAWVFGYSEDLLEAVPWFQPGDIVEVVLYNDPRWAWGTADEREWWILETVTRVQTGEGENIRCSLYWLQEVDGVTEARLASVYR